MARNLFASLPVELLQLIIENSTSSSIVTLAFMLPQYFIDNRLDVLSWDAIRQQKRVEELKGQDVVTIREIDTPDTQPLVLSAIESGKGLGVIKRIIEAYEKGGYHTWLNITEGEYRGVPPPLHVACRAGRPDVVAFLLAHNADPRIRWMDWRKTVPDGPSAFHAGCDMVGLSHHRCPPPTTPFQPTSECHQALDVAIAVAVPQGDQFGRLYGRFRRAEPDVVRRTEDCALEILKCQAFDVGMDRHGRMRRIVLGGLVRLFETVCDDVLGRADDDPARRMLSPGSLASLLEDACATKGQYVDGNHDMIECLIRRGALQNHEATVAHQVAQQGHDPVKLNLVHKSLVNGNPLNAVQMLGHYDVTGSLNRVLLRGIVTTCVNHARNLELDDANLPFTQALYRRLREGFHATALPPETTGAEDAEAMTTEAIHSPENSVLDTTMQTRLTKTQRWLWQQEGDDGAANQVSAVISAGREAHPNLLRRLLRLGFDVNRLGMPRTTGATTALDLAVYLRNWEAAFLLLANGADPALVCDRTRRDLRRFCVEESDSDAADITRDVGPERMVPRAFGPPIDEPQTDLEDSLHKPRLLALIKLVLGI